MRLTQEGRAVLDAARHRHALGQPDADGWLTEQLWVVMAVFGPHLVMGGPNLIETDIVFPGAPARTP